MYNTRNVKKEKTKANRGLFSCAVSSKCLTGLNLKLHIFVWAWQKKETPTGKIERIVVYWIFAMKTGFLRLSSLSE